MLLLEILTIVLPVFFVIGIGFLIRKAELVDHVFLHQTNQLIYYLALPSLLFYKIGTADFRANFNGTLVVVAILALLITMVLSSLWGWLRRYTPAEQGTFSQGSFRGNLAYVGLAIVFYAYGEEGLTRAGILMGFLVPALNLFAILALLWPHRKTGAAPSAGFWAKQLLLNPLILASLAGTAWSFLQWSMPMVLERTLQIVTGMALPLALLAIGGSFSLKKLKGDLGKAMLATCCKLLALPLLTYLLLTMAGVQGLDLAVGVLFAATPTATATFIMAHQMKGDAEMAGSIIMLATLLSAFSYTGWLLFLRTQGIA